MVCTGAAARTLWGLALAFLAFLHVPMLWPTACAGSACRGLALTCDDFERVTLEAGPTPLWPHLCIAPATHGKSDIEAVGAQVEIAI